MSARPPQKKRAASAGSDDLQIATNEIDATGVLEATTEPVDKQKNSEGAVGRQNTAVDPATQGMSRLQRVESVFRIGSLAAISASAVLAAFQFYQERLDTRKERSSDLMLMWQTGDARDAYARLRGAVEIALTEQGPIPANIPMTAFDDIKYNIGQTLIVNWQSGVDSEFAKWSNDVDMVNEFYTEVEFCIRAELCDETLLKAYFAEEVASFWDYFKYFADFQREGLYPNYGASVEKLVAVFNVGMSAAYAPN